MGASATASSQGAWEERGKSEIRCARGRRAGGPGARSVAATALAARRRVVSPFGALHDARRPGRHTPEYMHYSEHRHANKATKNN